MNFRILRLTLSAIGLSFLIALVANVSPISTQAAPLIAPYAAPDFECSTVSEIPQSECQALVSFYNSTGGNGWFARDGWLVTNTPCSWYQVTCKDGSVLSIGLIGNNLIGPLPPDIGNLSGLEGLFLNGNQLNGSIPNTVGNLSKLTQFRLFDNQLSGSIPAEFGNIGPLFELNLTNNQLSGFIPPQLGSLAVLDNFTASNNQLSGSIPAELGNAGNLKSLFLNGNLLSDSIPAQLGNLAILEKLSLANNQLTGPIPAELGNLSALQQLFLANNQLTGEIPGTFGNLANLTYLSMPFNNLSGSIPSSLGNLSRLQGLVLGGNQLSGNIPSTLGSLSQVSSLFIESNQLSGSVPNELGNLTQLKYLGISDNQLTGSVPSWIWDRTALAELQIGGNQFTRSDLNELSRLPNLVKLNISGLLNGDVPASVWSRPLTALYIANNQQSGIFPTQLLNMAQLTVLDISNNAFVGSLPSELLSFPLTELSFNNTSLCESRDVNFQSWLSTVASTNRTNQLCFGLAINHETGAPGSSFAITGIDFPSNTTAGVNVNGNFLKIVTVDSGSSFGILITTSDSNEPGRYTILVEAENVKSTITLILDGDEPVHVSGSGTAIALPTSTNALSDLFLPFVNK